MVREHFTHTQPLILSGGRNPPNRIAPWKQPRHPQASPALWRGQSHTLPFLLFPCSSSLPPTSTVNIPPVAHAVLSSTYLFRDLWQVNTDKDINASYRLVALSVTEVPISGSLALHIPVRQALPSRSGAPQVTSRIRYIRPRGSL